MFPRGAIHHGVFPRKLVRTWANPPLRDLKNLSGYPSPGLDEIKRIFQPYFASLLAFMNQ